jgi:outer membrane receptor protein involved in Fe transport
LQHEAKLKNWLIINAGIRYDRYEAFERVTPRAALILLPSEAQSFKYLYGSAFRAPNENELNTVYFGDRVTALRPESIDTHEVVWERYVNDRVRTSASAYWYLADRLITTTPDESTFLESTFVNEGRVRARGIELEAQIRLRGEARTQVSYALQEAVDQQTDRGLSNSPRHVAKARMSLPGPTAGSFVSFEAQYLSGRTTQADTRVKGAAVFNLHVIQPLKRSWELFGGVRNLFNTKYSDPVSGAHEQDAIQQNGATARIGLRWKLWKP